MTVRSMVSERVLLALIVLAYVGLAVFYAVTVPVFEAPKEVAHFFYAKHIADTRSLPVQDPRAPNLWAETGSQPPLYYLLVAAVISPVDTRRATDYLWRNPYVNLESPPVPGNKNYFVHTEREQWPYRDVSLAVHLARGVSILLGVLTVLTAYALARGLFARGWTALAVAATLAFIPQFIFVTSTVTADALALFTGTLALWLMVETVRRGISYGRAALLGFGVALVALSKVAGILFLVPGAVAVWLAGREDRRRGVLSLGVYLAVFLLTTGVWYARNQMLYGDPLGLTRLLPYARYAPPSPAVDALAREALWLLQSFWALFGWYNVPIGPRAYLLLHVVETIALIGLVVGLARRRSSPNAEPWAVLLGTLALALIPALAARGLGFVPLPQARHTFPALAVAVLLLVTGWRHIAPERIRPYWTAILPLGLFTLAVVVPGRWIAPAYARPMRIPPDRIPITAQRVDMVFDGRIRVWAVDIPQITTHTGDSVDVTLYMSRVGDVPVDYTLRIRLLGREREEVGRLESMTGWGTYPTRLWREGEIIVDHYRVWISSQARVPTLLRVEIGFLNHWSGRVLPITTTDGIPITGLVKTLRLISAHPTSPRPNAPLHASFDDEIALIGADPPPAQVTRGEDLTFRLYWQALRPARASYTIFTHLVREGDPHPVAQHDKLPLDGDYPTVAWAPGEIVADTYRIHVPEELPPGTYMVVTGVYHLQTLQRLPLREGPTRPWLTDAAVVATVEVR